MSLHVFRPNEPAQVLTPPVGTCGGKQGRERLRRLLTQPAGPFNRHTRRQLLCIALMVAGVACQLLCIAVTFYLVDLCIALMELWAELARKHLELTL